MNIVKEAYLFAKERHSGQKRPNGKSYFEHLKNIATILKEKKADDITISAALLHDLVEDTNTTLAEIRKKFGKEISFLVDGMTKIKGNLDNTLEKFERYAKKDKRLLAIKLADLYENLSQLNHEKYLSKEKMRLKYEGFVKIIKKLSKAKKEIKLADETLDKARKLLI